MSGGGWYDDDGEGLRWMDERKKGRKEGLRVQFKDAWINQLMAWVCDCDLTILL
jgi:hypothetical protein